MRETGRNGNLKKPAREPLTSYFYDLAWCMIGHKKRAAGFLSTYQVHHNGYRCIELTKYFSIN